jgi:hypothetical protein
MPNTSSALAANTSDVPSRRMRERKFAIQIPQFTRHVPAIHLTQQHRGRRLEHGRGGG